MIKWTSKLQDCFVPSLHKYNYPNDPEQQAYLSCPSCNASFINDRWSWEKTTHQTTQFLCPACERIAKNHPAGSVEIRGDFFNIHRDEIITLIHNIESVEKAAHPLERIMAITEADGHVKVTTTGTHLACKIGKMLSRAYQGEYSFFYGEGQQQIFVYWERNV
jgi:hypothetical protein